MQETFIRPKHSGLYSSVCEKFINVGLMYALRFKTRSVLIVLMQEKFNSEIQNQHIDDYCL